MQAKVKKYFWGVGYTELHRGVTEGTELFISVEPCDASVELCVRKRQDRPQTDRVNG